MTAEQIIQRSLYVGDYMALEARLLAESTKSPALARR